MSIVQVYVQAGIVWMLVGACVSSLLVVEIFRVKLEYCRGDRNLVVINVCRNMNLGVESFVRTSRQPDDGCLGQAETRSIK